MWKHPNDVDGNIEAQLVNDDTMNSLTNGTSIISDPSILPASIAYSTVSPTFTEEYSGNNEDMADHDSIISIVRRDTADKTDRSEQTMSITSSCCDLHDGSWVCRPYKVEVLAQQIDQNSPGPGRRTAIIGTLRDLGVKVFVIDSTNTETTQDVLHHVKRVVGYVSRENCVAPMTDPLGFQRCLLYQDRKGRLFNLMMSKHAVGPASKWEELLDSFSGFEAMVALTVLCRSLPCITQIGEGDNFRPAYLSLVLGLVLTEEISLSWLNASMMIKATPSVSAHTLTSRIGSDMLRKTMLLFLALAGATTGPLANALTLLGIGGAVMILLANLGSRAWHFIGWAPQSYRGPGAGLIAYLKAVVVGICLPYMGHRSITVGGKAAMESVILTSFKVALIFILSDLDEIQKFLVVGSEQCDQQWVNAIVGIWWFFTTLCSLFLVCRIPYENQKPQDGEHLLEHNHASPVGYRVPKLPDFEIDPSLANTGSGCLSLKTEFAFGVIMAAAVGTLIIYSGFTDWDKQAVDEIQNIIQKVF